MDGGDGGGVASVKFYSIQFAHFTTWARSMVNWAKQLQQLNKKDASEKNERIVLECSMFIYISLYSDASWFFNQKYSICNFILWL